MFHLLLHPPHKKNLVDNETAAKRLYKLINYITFSTVAVTQHVGCPPWHCRTDSRAHTHTHTVSLVKETTTNSSCLRPMRSTQQRVAWDFSAHAQAHTNTHSWSVFRQVSVNLDMLCEQVWVCTEWEMKASLSSRGSGETHSVCGLGAVCSCRQLEGVRRISYQCAAIAGVTKYTPPHPLQLIVFPASLNLCTVSFHYPTISPCCWQMATCGRCQRPTLTETSTTLWQYCNGCGWHQAAVDFVESFSLRV